MHFGDMHLVLLWVVYVLIISWSLADLYTYYSLSTQSRQPEFTDAYLWLFLRVNKCVNDPIIDTEK